MVVVLWFAAYLVLVLVLAVWRGRHDAARKKHRHKHHADAVRARR